MGAPVRRRRRRCWSSWRGLTSRGAQRWDQEHRNRESKDDDRAQRSRNPRATGPWLVRETRRGVGSIPYPFDVWGCPVNLGQFTSPTFRHPPPPATAWRVTAAPSSGERARPPRTSPSSGRPRPVEGPPGTEGRARRRRPPLPRVPPYRASSGPRCEQSPASFHRHEVVVILDGGSVAAVAQGCLLMFRYASCISTTVPLSLRLRPRGCVGTRLPDRGTGSPLPGSAGGGVGLARLLGGFCRGSRTR